MRKLRSTNLITLISSAIAAAALIALPAEAQSIGPLMVAAAPAGMAIPCEAKPLQYSFDQSAEGFTSNNAMWLMWMTLRAYAVENPATGTEMASIGFRDYTPIINPLTHLRGFVTANDDTVVVAFAGSTSVADSLIDISIAEIDGAPFGLPGKVHAGFAVDIAASWDDIRAAIDAYGGAHKKIWVTGQSLGGALATITAYRLAGLGYKLAPLYTFAAPRSGDSVYAEAGDRLLGGRQYHVDNTLDLVPHVPPRASSAPWLRQTVPGPLGNVIGDIFAYGFDYAQSGHSILLNTSGALAPEVADDAAGDSAYWQDVAKLIDEKGVLAAIAALQARQVAIHTHVEYFCLTQAYRGLTTPAPMPLQVSSD